MTRCALALAVAALAFSYLAAFCDNARFYSDPIDYLAAAGKGFRANYLDSDKITPWGLLALIRTQPEARSHPWDYLERNDEPASRRHFHAAASFYPYAIAADAGADARAQRLITAAEGALAIGVTFFGLQEAGVGLVISLASCLLILLSPASVNTFTDPSPHAMFLLLVLGFGFVFARVLKGGADQRLLCAAAALFAALIATMELSIVIAIAVMAMVAARWLQRRAHRWKRLTVPALAGLISLVLIWPGGFIRGGYLLSYGVFLFQALFRRGNYFGAATPLDIAMRAGDMSPLILLVILGIAALTVFLLIRRRFDTYLEVFAWLTLGFAIQGVLNRFHNATYQAHFAALVWTLGALSAQRWIEPARSARAKSVTLIAIAVAGWAAVSWPGESRQLARSRDQVSGRLGSVLSYVSNNLPPDAPLVAYTDRPVWRYYLPARRLDRARHDDARPETPVSGMNYWLIADPSLLPRDWRSGIAVGAEVKLNGYSLYPCHLP